MLEQWPKLTPHAALSALTTHDSSVFSPPRWPAAAVKWRASWQVLLDFLPFLLPPAPSGLTRCAVASAAHPSARSRIGKWPEVHASHIDRP